MTRMFMVRLPIEMRRVFILAAVAAMLAPPVAVADNHQDSLNAEHLQQIPVKSTRTEQSPQQEASAVSPPVENENGSSVPAGPAWALVSRANDGSYVAFFDLNSVRHTAGNVQAWTRYVYPKVQQVANGVAYQEIRELLRFYCATGETQIRRTMAYDRHGILLASGSSDFEPRQPVVAGSMGQNLLQIACEQVQRPIPLRSEVLEEMTQHIMAEAESVQSAPMHSPMLGKGTVALPNAR